MRTFLGIALLMTGSALSMADPAGFEQALEQAHQLLQTGRLPDAEEAFVAAGSLPGADESAVALGLATTHNRMGDFRKAANEAASALDGTQDLDCRIRAANQLGIAMASQGKSKKKLTQAEEAFRQALDLSGGQLNLARYSLARVLILEKRVDDAIPLLEEFLQHQSEGNEAQHARAIVAHPDRAAQQFAPDFSLETLDGRVLRSTELRGNVVLLDFWATWCGPCEAALPHLKKFVTRHADEPVVVIGISVDDEAEVVNRYVESNEMTWAQHWDKRGQMSRATFGVDGYPTYIVIDPDGFVTGRALGWTPGTRRTIDKAVEEGLEVLTP